MSTVTTSASDYPEHPVSNRKSQITNPLLWASYLGVSWTWVIGMFLPVLLIRDYGVWAWVIFALPNCLGAAAMGWTMRTGEQSLRFTHNHFLACRIFSLVTIAFHIFFAIWMLPRLLGAIGWVVAAILVQSAFTPYLKRNRAVVASVVVWLVSLTLAGVLGSRGSLLLPAAGAFNPGDIAGLSLVCLLGFIFCPYFDLTFHRARQNTSTSGAKVAFGVGFCLIFCSMIVFTLLYADGLLNYNLSRWLIGAHLSIQMLFTVLAHSDVLYHQAEQREDVGDLRAILSAAMAAGFAAGFLTDSFLRLFGFTEVATYHGMALGEVAYRSFMSFYGLICPAYAMISIPSRKPRWILTCLTIVIAMPFYWMAFIEKQMVWACIGGGIVLLAGILIKVSSTSHRSMN